MPNVTDIKVLNIDEVPYAVDSLPEEVQTLVEIYNDWSRKEAEVSDELTRFQAAKETLSRQIITKVRVHIEATAAATESESESESESATEAVNTTEPDADAK